MSSQLWVNTQRSDPSQTEHSRMNAASWNSLFNHKIKQIFHQLFLALPALLLVDTLPWLLYHPPEYFKEFILHLNQRCFGWGMVWCSEKRYIRNEGAEDPGLKDRYVMRGWCVKYSFLQFHWCFQKSTPVYTFSWHSVSREAKGPLWARVMLQCSNYILCHKSKIRNSNDDRKKTTT